MDGRIVESVLELDGTRTITIELEDGTVWCYYGCYFSDVHYGYPDQDNSPDQDN